MGSLQTQKSLQILNMCNLTLLDAILILVSYVFIWFSIYSLLSKIKLEYDVKYCILLSLGIEFICLFYYITFYGVK